MDILASFRVLVHSVGIRLSLPAGLVMVVRPILEWMSQVKRPRKALEVGVDLLQQRIKGSRCTQSGPEEGHELQL